MSYATNWLSAGLVFLGARQIDIVAVSNRVSNAFENLGQPVSGVRVLTDGCAQISTRDHELTVELLDDYEVAGLDRPAPLFLSLDVSRLTSHSPDDTPAVDSILAHALKALQRMLSADYVNWTQPGMLLDSSDFELATTQLGDGPEAPKRAPCSRGLEKANPKHDLPSIEETNERLQRRLTQREALERGLDEPFRTMSMEVETASNETSEVISEDIREDTVALRLTVWMMSFIIALFALPVAAALIVVNLVKGENLRLASQTAAISGIFVAFQLYGTTAQAMSVLKHYAP